MPTHRWFVRAFLFAAALACTACAHRAPKITTIEASDSRGKTLFAAQCAACHGANGNGGQIGPSLRKERSKKDRDAIIEAIEQPSPPMPKLYPARLNAQDVADIAAYVESL